MKRTLKEVLKRCLIYSIVLSMILSTNIVELLNTGIERVAGYSSMTNTDVYVGIGTPTGTGKPTGILAEGVYDYRISLYREPEASMNSEKINSSFSGYRNMTYKLGTGAPIKESIKGTWVINNYSEFFGGYVAKGHANKHKYYKYVWTADSATASLKTDGTFDEGDDLHYSAHSTSSLRHIYYDSIKSLSKEQLKSQWKSIAQAHASETQAFVDWISTSETGQAATTNINARLLQYYNPNGYSLDGLDSKYKGTQYEVTEAQREELWYRYLDALMCCYILAGEHQGNEWEAAIDDYISGTNLDKQPISIMIEACPVITVNNLRGDISGIDYFTAFAQLNQDFAPSGINWWTAARKSNYARNFTIEGAIGAIGTAQTPVSLGEDGTLALFSSASNVMHKAYNQLGATDPRKGWSGGIPARTISKDYLKGIDSNGYLISVNQGTYKIMNKTGIAAEYDGINSENYSIYGFSIHAMPCSTTSQEFGKLVALPDNKPVEGEIVDENVSLAVYSGIEQSDLQYWLDLVNEAKYTNKNFTITIDWTVSPTGLKNYTKAIISDPTITTYTPEQMLEWVKGKKAINTYDKTLSKLFNDNADKCVITYTANIKIKLGEQEITSSVTDTASFMPKLERIGYTSKPQAYTEFKNYGVGSNMSGTLREDFEAMAGVPSTEQMYFAAGGSEFIVDVTLNEVNDEVAYRTYDNYFTGTSCEFKQGDSADKTWNVPSYSGNLLQGSDYTINPHTGDLTVSVTIGGTIHNSSPDPGESLHTNTWTAQADPGDVADRAAAYQALSNWYQAACNYQISWTAASDHKTRQDTLGNLASSKSLPGCPSNVPQSTSDSNPCKAKPASGTPGRPGYKPAIPCANEMAHASEPSPVNWSVTATITIPCHVICGPCCQHELPEVHDTWTQSVKYDSMEINDVHVWRIDQGAIEGLEEIIAIDKVGADVVTNEPNIFYNIALKNDPNYKSKGYSYNGNKYGTATGSSYVGRIKYTHETESFDCVVRNLGVRTNKCDGLAKTCDHNKIVAGGGGHSEVYSTGFIYTGSSEGYNSSRTGNSKHGETASKLNPRTNITGGANFVTQNTDTKDKATKEYSELMPLRDYTTNATMITDFLILQTSSGDQSVMYYQQDSPRTVKVDEQIPDIEVGTLGPQGGAVKGGAISAKMWFNNSLSAANWTPTHIALGSYTGKYWLGSGKFNGTAGGANVATKWDTNWRSGSSKAGKPITQSQGKLVMNRPNKVNRLMIYSGFLNIKLSNLNGAYYTGYSEVFWSNQLHWCNKAYTRLNKNGAQVQPYASRTKFTDGAPYATTVTKFKGSATDVYYSKVDGSGSVMSTYQNKAKFQFGASDYVTKAGYALKAIYSDGKSKCNDIVIHDPVSTYDTYLISLPEYRDQRTTKATESMNDILNKNKVCPGSPGECDYRILDCQYFKDTLLFSSDFNTEYTSNGKACIKNNVTGNLLTLPSGFYIEPNSTLGSKALSSFGTRFRIPFNELNLEYASSTHLRVEADIQITPNGTSQMIFSFNNFDLWLPSTDEYGKADNPYVYFNSGHGHEKKVNEPLADGKKHHIVVEFAFAGVPYCTMKIDGKACTYTTILTPYSIDSTKIGNTFNIGSWNANDYYKAGFYIDNLKIYRAAGTSQHTDECYVVEMIHENGGANNAHKHTSSCLADSSKYEPGMLVKQQNGYTWGRVFYHDTAGGFYNSASEALSTKSTYKFSVLDKIQNFKYAGDSKYIFMLYYPETGQTNIWKQSKRPQDDYIADGDGSGVATGYEPISISMGDNFWGGLTKSTSSTTLIDGSVNHPNWFYAIGSYTQWGTGANTIPGGNNASVNKVELWMAVDPSYASAGSSATFGYNGNYQIYTVPSNGYYRLEAWGASGGGNNPYSTAVGSRAGLGGYTAGTTYLTAGTKLYIYVGGAGTLVNNWTAGGFNGGGGASFSGNPLGTGGGASDIRLTGGSWNNFNSLASRILVAGGGGGSDDVGDTSGLYNGGNDESGGNGGGLTGQAAITEGNRATYGYGTQTSGGNAASGGASGGFGYGGGSTDAGDYGGGGGGYYGGASGGGLFQGGAGGSSYVSRYPGCDTTYTAYQGNYSFTDVVLQQGGNYGNGKVTITRVSSIVDDILNGLKTGSMSEAELRKYLGTAYDYIKKTYSETIIQTYADWSSSMNGFFSVSSSGGKQLSNGSLQVNACNGYEIGLDTEIDGSALSKIEIVYQSGYGPSTNAAGIGIKGTGTEVSYRAASLSTNSNGDVIATIVPNYSGTISRLYFDTSAGQPSGVDRIKRILIYGYGTASTKSKNIDVVNTSYTGNYIFNTSTLSQETYTMKLLNASVVQSNGATIASASSNEQTVTKTLPKSTSYTANVSSASGSRSFGTGESSFTAPATTTYSVDLYGAGGGSDAERVGSSGYRVAGTLNINAGSTITFRVGGAGASNASGSGGGYPDGYNAGSSGSSGAGGGSTSLFINGGLVAQARGGDGGSYENYAGYGGSYDGAGLGGGSNYTGGINATYNGGGGSSGNGAAYISWNSPGRALVQVTRTVLVINNTNYNANTRDLLMKYYTLIPDKVDGKDNPIWGNCNHQNNYHLCTDKCKLSKTLICSEPHHEGLHYEHSNTICWKACNNDNKHKIPKSKVNTGDATKDFIPGNFINLDYGFTIYFPNRGKFDNGQPYCLGNITTQRGRGYKDTYTKDLPYGTTTSGLNGGIPATSSGLLGQNVGMNTTKWTRVKRIKFDFDVIYDNYLYLAGEWITLGDRGTYNSTIGKIGNTSTLGKYDDTKWSNFGTKLYNGIYQEYYDFYCVLENNEARNTKYTVEVTALNCRNFRSSGNNQVNDNISDITNKERSSAYSALHGGTNTYYFDIVGRIGNLILEDVEDFRFSNLFKTAVNDGNKSLANVTKEYTPNSGLSTTDHYNTDNNGINRVNNYITTNSSGAYVCVKDLEPEKAFYEIIVEGKGLSAGRLEVTDNISREALDDELFTVITKSSVKQSWYMDLSNLKINSMDIKYIAKSNATMSIQKITVIKLGEAPDSWLLDGIVSEVDETKPRDYMSWVADVRGIRISSKTKWVDTYGTEGWAQKIGNNHNLNFPLSPEKNNISILQDDPMLTGYSAFMDITTIGNYNLNSDAMQIIPRYYAIDLTKEQLIPLDVYMKHGSAYVPINYFKNVNKNSNKVYNKEIYENIINLDWLYEKDRRNVTKEEESKTDAVHQATLDFANEINAVKQDNISYEALETPGGHVCTLGTNQYLQLDGHARTFIGGESTYGELKNINSRVNALKWYMKAQRWHFSIGVPSSAVFVKQGQQVNKDTMIELSDGNYVVICVLDITAVGEIYSLKYKHQYSGSEANSTKGTDSGYSLGAEGGIIKIKDNNGVSHTINLYDAKYNSEIKYDPVVFVYNPALNSTQDIEIIGTH